MVGNAPNLGGLNPDDAQELLRQQQEEAAQAQNDAQAEAASSANADRAEKAGEERGADPVKTVDNPFQAGSNFGPNANAETNAIQSLPAEKKTQILIARLEAQLKNNKDRIDEQLEEQETNQEAQARAAEALARSNNPVAAAQAMGAKTPDQIAAEQRKLEANLTERIQLLQLKRQAKDLMAAGKTAEALELLTSSNIPITEFDQNHTELLAYSNALKAIETGDTTKAEEILNNFNSQPQLEETNETEQAQEAKAKKEENETASNKYKLAGEQLANLLEARANGSKGLDNTIEMMYELIAKDSPGAVSALFDENGSPGYTVDVDLRSSGTRSFRVSGAEEKQVNSNPEVQKAIETLRTIDKELAKTDTSSSRSSSRNPNNPFLNEDIAREREEEVSRQRKAWLEARENAQTLLRAGNFKDISKLVSTETINGQSFTRPRGISEFGTESQNWYGDTEQRTTAARVYSQLLSNGAGDQARAIPEGQDAETTVRNYRRELGLSIEKQQAEIEEIQRQLDGQTERENNPNPFSNAGQPQLTEQETNDRKAILELRRDRLVANTLHKLDYHNRLTQDVNSQNYDRALGLITNENGQLIDQRQLQSIEVHKTLKHSYATKDAETSAKYRAKAIAAMDLSQTIPERARLLAKRNKEAQENLQKKVFKTDRETYTTTQQYIRDRAAIDKEIQQLRTSKYTAKHKHNGAQIRKNWEENKKERIKELEAKREALTKDFNNYLKPYEEKKVEILREQDKLRRQETLAQMLMQQNDYEAAAKVLQGQEVAKKDTLALPQMKEPKAVSQEDKVNEYRDFLRTTISATQFQVSAHMREIAKLNDQILDPSLIDQKEKQALMDQRDVYISSMQSLAGGAEHLHQTHKRLTELAKEEKYQEALEIINNGEFESEQKYSVSQAEEILQTELAMTGNERSLEFARLNQEAREIRQRLFNAREVFDESVDKKGWKEERDHYKALQRGFFFGFGPEIDYYSRQLGDSIDYKSALTSSLVDLGKTHETAQNWNSKDLTQNDGDVYNPDYRNYFDRRPKSDQAYTDAISNLRREIAEARANFPELTQDIETRSIENAFFTGTRLSTEARLTEQDQGRDLKDDRQRSEAIYEQDKDARYDTLKNAAISTGAVVVTTVSLGAGAPFAVAVIAGTATGTAVGTGSDLAYATYAKDMSWRDAKKFAAERFGNNLTTSATSSFFSGLGRVAGGAAKHIPGLSRLSPANANLIRAGLGGMSAGSAESAGSASQELYMKMSERAEFESKWHEEHKYTYSSGNREQIAALEAQKAAEIKARGIDRTSMARVFGSSILSGALSGGIGGGSSTITAGLKSIDQRIAMEVAEEAAGFFIATAETLAQGLEPGTKEYDNALLGNIAGTALSKFVGSAAGSDAQIHERQTSRTIGNRDLGQRNRNIDDVSVTINENLQEGEYGRTTVIEDTDGNTRVEIELDPATARRLSENPDQSHSDILRHINSAVDDYRSSRPDPEPTELTEIEARAIRLEEEYHANQQNIDPILRDQNGQPIRDAETGEYKTMSRDEYTGRRAYDEFAAEYHGKYYALEDEIALARDSGNEAKVKELETQKSEVMHEYAPKLGELNIMLRDGRWEAAAHFANTNGLSDIDRNNFSRDYDANSSRDPETDPLRQTSNDSTTTDSNKEGRYIDFSDHSDPELQKVEADVSYRGTTSKNPLVLSKIAAGEVGGQNDVRIYGSFNPISQLGYKTDFLANSEILDPKKFSSEEEYQAARARQFIVAEAYAEAQVNESDAEALQASNDKHSKALALHDSLVKRGAADFASSLAERNGYITKENVTDFSRDYDSQRERQVGDTLFIETKLYLPRDQRPQKPAKADLSQVTMPDGVRDFRNDPSITKVQASQIINQGIERSNNLPEGVDAQTEITVREDGKREVIVRVRPEIAQAARDGDIEAQRIIDREKAHAQEESVDPGNYLDGEGVMEAKVYQAKRARLEILAQAQAAAKNAQTESELITANEKYTRALNQFDELANNGEHYAAVDSAVDNGIIDETRIDTYRHDYKLNTERNPGEPVTQSYIDPERRPETKIKADAQLQEKGAAIRAFRKTLEEKGGSQYLQALDELSKTQDINETGALAAIGYRLGLSVEELLPPVVDMARDNLRDGKESTGYKDGKLIHKLERNLPAVKEIIANPENKDQILAQLPEETVEMLRERGLISGALYETVVDGNWDPKIVNELFNDFVKDGGLNKPQRKERILEVLDVHLRNPDAYPAEHARSLPEPFLRDEDVQARVAKQIQRYIDSPEEAARQFEAAAGAGGFDNPALKAIHSQVADYTVETFGPEGFDAIAEAVPDFAQEYENQIKSRITSEDPSPENTLATLEKYGTRFESLLSPELVQAAKDDGSYGEALTGYYARTGDKSVETKLKEANALAEAYKQRYIATQNDADLDRYVKEKNKGKTTEEVLAHKNDQLIPGISRDLEALDKTREGIEESATSNKELNQNLLNLEIKLREQAEIERQVGGEDPNSSEGYAGELASHLRRIRRDLESRRMTPTEAITELNRFIPQRTKANETQSQAEYQARRIIEDLESQPGLIDPDRLSMLKDEDLADGHYEDIVAWARSNPRTAPKAALAAAEYKAHTRNSSLEVVTNNSLPEGIQGRTEIIFDADGNRRAVIELAPGIEEKARAGDKAAMKVLMEEYGHAAVTKPIRATETDPVTGKTKQLSRYEFRARSAIEEVAQKMEANYQTEVAFGRHPTSARALGDGPYRSQILSLTKAIESKDPKQMAVALENAKDSGLINDGDIANFDENYQNQLDGETRQVRNSGTTVAISSEPQVETRNKIGRVEAEAIQTKRNKALETINKHIGDAQRLGIELARLKATGVVSEIHKANNRVVFSVKEGDNTVVFKVYGDDQRRIDETERDLQIAEDHIPESYGFVERFAKDEDGNYLGIPGEVIATSKLEGEKAYDFNNDPRTDEIGLNPEVIDAYTRNPLDSQFVSDFIDANNRLLDNGSLVNDLITPGNVLYTDSDPQYPNGSSFNILDISEDNLNKAGREKYKQLAEENPMTLTLNNLVATALPAGHHTDMPLTYDAAKKSGTDGYPEKLRENLIAGIDQAIADGHTSREEVHKALDRLLDIYSGEGDISGEDLGWGVIGSPTEDLVFDLMEHYQGEAPDTKPQEPNKQPTNNNPVNLSPLPKGSDLPDNLNDSETVISKLKSIRNRLAAVPQSLKAQKAVALVDEIGGMPQRYDSMIAIGEPADAFRNLNQDYQDKLKQLQKSLAELNQEVESDSTLEDLEIYESFADNDPEIRELIEQDLIGQLENNSFKPSSLQLLNLSGDIDTQAIIRRGKPMPAEIESRIKFLQEINSRMKQITADEKTRDALVDLAHHADDIVKRSYILMKLDQIVTKDVPSLAEFMNHPQQARHDAIIIDNKDASMASLAQTAKLLDETKDVENQREFINSINAVRRTAKQPAAADQLIKDAKNSLRAAKKESSTDFEQNSIMRGAFAEAEVVANAYESKNENVLAHGVRDFNPSEILDTEGNVFIDNQGILDQNVRNFRGIQLGEVQLEKQAVLDAQGKAIRVHNGKNFTDLVFNTRSQKFEAGGKEVSVFYNQRTGSFGAREIDLITTGQLGPYNGKFVSEIKSEASTARNKTDSDRQFRVLLAVAAKEKAHPVYRIGRTKTELTAKGEAAAFTNEDIRFWHSKMEQAMHEGFDLIITDKDGNIVNGYINSEYQRITH